MISWRFSRCRVRRWTCACRSTSAITPAEASRSARKRSKSRLSRPLRAFRHAARTRPARPQSRRVATPRGRRGCARRRPRRCGDRRRIADLAQPLDVRSRAAADTCERHDDDAMRPEVRRVEQRRRTDERVAAEIEREDDARIVLQAGDQRGVALRLAAENEVTVVKPGRGRAGFGEAVVDPERKPRETRP